MVHYTFANMLAVRQVHHQKLQTNKNMTQSFLSLSQK